MVLAVKICQKQSFQGNCGSLSLSLSLCILTAFRLGSKVEMDIR